MSLEQEISKLTAALINISDALAYIRVPEQKSNHAENAGGPELPEQKSNHAEKQGDVAEIGYNDVSSLILRLSKEKGRESAVALLEKFGAKKLPDVKPEKLSAVYAAATKALEAA